VLSSISRGSNASAVDVRFFNISRVLICPFSVRLNNSTSPWSARRAWIESCTVTELTAVFSSADLTRSKELTIRSILSGIGEKVEFLANVRISERLERASLNSTTREKVPSLLRTEWLVIFASFDCFADSFASLYASQEIQSEAKPKTMPARLAHEPASLKKVDAGKVLGSG